MENEQSIVREIEELASQTVTIVDPTTEIEPDLDGDPLAIFNWHNQHRPMPWGLPKPPDMAREI